MEVGFSRLVADSAKRFYVLSMGFIPASAVHEFFTNTRSAVIHSFIRGYSWMVYFSKIFRLTAET
jgi:hypothetical protein